MSDASTITCVFNELIARYNRISISTIKSALNGSFDVRGAYAEVLVDKNLPPSLPEVETMFQNYNCSIFTAFRGGFTLEQNLQRNAFLKDDMNNEGLVYRPVKGCYKEAGMELPDVEYCFFVFNSNKLPDFEFFSKCYNLAEKYDQDSFLFKRGGINNVAFLIATNDDARGYLHGDIYFTGQYFAHVEDVIAWTDCSDGRFAFQRKGMVLIGSGNKKIKFGEGDIFDIEGYQPDGVVVLYDRHKPDLADACKSYNGTVPLIRHAFKNDDYSVDAVHDVVFSCMRQLRDKKCKRIGFHCSVSVNGSATEGAAAAYDALLSWANRFNKKFDLIVIVDAYGDYSKVLNDRK